MAIIGTILLTILKIILIIVCVVVALLCLILFVPVKYELSGTKEGSNLSGHVEVTFLFRAIVFRLKAEKKRDAELAKSMHFFIFGIDPKERKEKKRQKKREEHHKKKKAYLDRLKEEDPEKYEELKAEARARRETRQAAEARSEGEVETSHAEDTPKKEPEPSPEKNAGSKTENDAPKASAEQEEKARTKKPKKKRNWSVIPYKIIEGIGHFFSKLCHISNGFSYWFSFLTSPLFLNALHHVSGSVIRLLKALLPKKLSGRVEMGFDDPSMTGRALAFACAYLKAYGPDFYVIPDFDGSKLEGSASCTGAIRLILPARLVVSLLLDRNVREAYHIFKNRKEEA